MANNEDRFRRNHERFGMEYHFKQGPREGSYGICTAIIEEHNPYSEEFHSIGIGKEFNNLIRKLDEDHQDPNSRSFILSIDLKLDYTDSKTQDRGGN